MWDILLDMLFPRHSLTGTPGVWITDEERRALRSFPVRFEAHEFQKRGVRSLDRVIAGSTYEHSPYLRLALHRYKYGRVRTLANDLGLLLVGAFPLLSEYPDSVVCPVPLHWLRTVQRGFNQAQLLADVVGRHTGLPVRALLRRSRATGHQAWRNRRERRGAMRRAFICVEPVPSSVILIDDVLTTGATLEACARALKERGAAHVQALVVAAA